MGDSRVSYNIPGALFSFLRLLIVAEASALLPLFTVAAPEDGTWPTLSVVGLAMVPPLLMTTINFFRPGETRFGPPPNPGAPAD